MDDGMTEQRTDGRVARVDRWRVRFDAADLATDSRGFAQIWGTVITADAVLEYGTADGHEDGHREFVPESTVFDEAALSSLRNAPVTFLHPAEPVNAGNSVRLTVGHIVDVKRDGTRLRALHQIEDALTLEKIGDGVIELSPGYTTRLEEAAGLVIDGREVHAIQRDRVYNHNAIVPEARAGHDNALTIDAAVLPADGLRIQQRGPIMAKYTLDGKEFEVDEALLNHIKSLHKDAEHEELGEEDGKSEDEKDEKDEKAADSDAPPNSSTDAKPVDAAAIAAAVTKEVLSALRKDEKVRTAASARTVSIIASARDALPQSYAFDGKTDEQIMRDAVKAHDPELAPKVKTLRGDALFGAFTVALATSTRSDGIQPFPVTARADGMAKVFELQKARLDAAQSCGVAGADAMRHPDVLKAKAQ